MTIVSNKEYYERIRKFVEKHDVVRVETSALEDGKWNKTYLCADATGFETNREVWEEVEVEVKGLKCKAKVHLLETEWFDTDNAESIYMYERY